MINRRAQHLPHPPDKSGKGEMSARDNIHRGTYIPSVSINSRIRHTPGVTLVHPAVGRPAYPRFRRPLRILSEFGDLSLCRLML
jgi:hypothetical protein